jgi:hypothetical protein
MALQQLFGLPARRRATISASTSGCFAVPVQLSGHAKLMSDDFTGASVAGASTR